VKRCTGFEELLVESLYGEIDEERRVELDAHLAGCETCARLLEEMRGTLEVMSRYERRDPGPEFWAGYWDRLQERMADAAGTPVEDTTKRSWWRARVAGRPVASWTYRAAAAAAILVLGIFVGRTFFMPAVEVSEPPVTASGGAVQDTTPGGDVPVPTGDVPRTGGGGEVVLTSSDRAMRYVQKSQVLILGLVNTDPSADGYAADLETQRTRSRELLAQAPDIKNDLNDPRQRRLRELVDELEKILMQIANLEEEEDYEEVDFIRGTVNRHDVLLKINLEQLRYGDSRAQQSGTPDAGDDSNPRKGSI